MVLGFFIDLMERGLLPQSCIRWGIRHLCHTRLKSLASDNPEQEQERDSRYIQELKQSAIAFATQKANQQHYEIPAEFYNLVLGPRRKYSSGFWPENCQSLAESEDQALEISIQRAEIEDGMSILDLGCGWGSMTLKLAEMFPNANIKALSNSSSQREFIMAEAQRRGFMNIQVVTGDISVFAGQGWESTFDRVVSIEMLEHVRNYEALFEKISGWLKPGGKMFVHIFSHRQHAYPFDVEGEDNWMGRYFFTGGQMPSHHLLTRFQKHLLLEDEWAWSGRHYQKTSEAWLRNMDLHRGQILEIFKKVYGENEASRWLERWRVFFMSCAELFGYRQGREWGVSHYRFVKR
ncbi:MAG: class I SAM-dependent methyltransferase [Bdellovibrionales bacterium]|nr:class I SAM-dependent methyltransferase [Bdellovibrionales bacterium]